MAPAQLANCDVYNAEFAVRVILTRYIKMDCNGNITCVLREYELSYKLRGHVF